MKKMHQGRSVEGEKWNSVYSCDELNTCVSLDEIIFQNMQFVKEFENFANVKKVENVPGQTCMPKTLGLGNGKSVSTFPTCQLKKLDSCATAAGNKYLEDMSSRVKSTIAQNTAMPTFSHIKNVNREGLKHVRFSESVSHQGCDGSEHTSGLTNNSNDQVKTGSMASQKSDKSSSLALTKIEEALETFLESIRGAQRESCMKIPQSLLSPLISSGNHVDSNSEARVAVKARQSSWNGKRMSNAKFTAHNVEPEDPNMQMKKLTRDWIVSALNTPNSMRQIVTQFRHIVEGFWPFNNPSLMNVPHPDIMHVIAEEMQTILIKCEAKTVGYPCVAAQPRSMPHFCNYLNLLGHFISEFVNLPFPVPDFLMDIAFRSCVLCLQPPLQWQMAQALVRLWRMVGCEMEARLHDFGDLVDGIRDAVLLGERAPIAGDDDGPDPKALLIEALELRARRWRPASKSGEGGDVSVASACAAAAAAAAAAVAEGSVGSPLDDGGGGGGVTALTEALARATLRVENFGAAGDCGRSAAAARVGVAL